MDRSASALGTTVADLLPTTASPETLPILRDQARALFESLLRTADRETLLMPNPLPARLDKAPGQHR